MKFLIMNLLNHIFETFMKKLKIKDLNINNSPVDYGVIN